MKKKKGGKKRDFSSECKLLSVETPDKKKGKEKRSLSKEKKDPLNQMSKTKPEKKQTPNTKK